MKMFPDLDEDMWTIIEQTKDVVIKKIFNGFSFVVVGSASPQLVMAVKIS